MRRQVITASVVAAAVIPLSPGVAGAAQTKVRTPTASSEAASLVKSTKALKKSTPKRGQLIVLASRIKRQQASQPCAAIGTIKIYRGQLRKLPKGARKRTLSVDATALGLSQRLLRSSKAKKCGGGVKPATVTEPTPSLRRNDATGLDATINLPEVNLGSVDKGGKLWTELGAKNAESGGAPGQPAIPVASYTVAVPDGATIETVAQTGDSYTLKDVDVVPVQPEPVDADEKKPDFFGGVFKDPAFVAPNDAYKGTFPAKPADAISVGEARGLKLATLQIPLAQYDGKKRTLQVRRSVNLKIDFKGGDQFGGQGGPWDKLGMSLASSYLNGSPVLEQWKKRTWWPLNCGEEFTIITNTSMRASADKLAVARNASGIKTRVFETVAGQAGTTNDQIRDFIRGRATHPFCVRPGYVLILGNDESVPTFEIGGMTSDLPYATTNDADTLPDLAQARIPGSITEVDTAIDKIIAYGAAPLPGAAATNAMIAAQFQDDDGDGRENRTFIQFAETVATGLEARGVNVSRVYGEEPHGNPQKFNDGTDLPASLKKPGFAWDGDGADVSAAWNAGTFLGIHRDHGWSDGWGTPLFTTANVEALTNTALPVLMSINCSSGAYDRDDTSFVTRALGRPGGGAVAVFGDTEDSPSTHNSVQGLGFVDALLPSILPSEGPASKQRLGDALVHGKVRLNNLYPAPGDGNTVKEHRIWHLFGDPTMRMRGGSGRLVFDPSIFTIKFQFVATDVPPNPIPEPRPGYQVIMENLQALEGQTIALRKGTEVVGQGLVEGGKVTIPAIFGDGSVKPGDLTVVIDAPTDAAPVVLDVPVPAPTPAPAPAATTLTQTCPTAVAFGSPMTVSGKLTGVPAGTELKVKFTYEKDSTNNNGAPNPPKSVEVTTKTDESGNYTASYQTIRQDQGEWSVKSTYAGDATHQGSQSAPCAVIVSTGPTVG
ncbi:MAG: hypothetical protein JHD16_14650 [Solirubrobacteraceae bacterium]|nr:hypothetical protein [Solirubrobacteraceae bacterium]